MQKVNPNSLITVGTFGEVYQAHMFRTFLAENNIESFIADEHIVTANWLYTNAIGGLRVSVRHVDAPTARQLLNEHQQMLRGEVEPIDWGAINPEWADDALPEDKNSTKPNKYACPKCACTQAHYEAFDRRLVFFSILLLGIPLPFLSRTWICDRCGHRWKNKLFS